MKRNGYATYLTSTHWRQFRRHAARQLRQVCACGARDGLELHHLTYERLGCEQLEDVAWLCAGCHRALHRDDPNGGLFLPDAVNPDRDVLTPDRLTAVSRAAEKRERERIEVALRNRAARRRRVGRPLVTEGGQG